ncbi:MAG: hypothetical protein ABW328_16845 [Ilumatobacteraceae bacterium]
MIERSPLIATALGLPHFPGTASDTARGTTNGHIMGVVVLAWLTQYPVRRWGREWAERGTMRLRYREHLSAGTALTVVVSDGAELGFEILDGEGKVCADGRAGLAGPANDGGYRLLDPPATPFAAPARPFPGPLQNLVLRPFDFDFDADRDLAFVDELADGEWWRSHGWAHPAWVASGVNAMLGQSIAFDDGGYWRHAGSELRHLRPVPSGARVQLQGMVDELFQGRHHRFGVARITAFADDVPVADLGVTFVYGAALPTPA